MSIFLSNEEWHPHNFTVQLDRQEFNYGFFPVLVYKIQIERKPFFYVCNLVAPTTILTVTALIGFHMPSGGNGVHVEKVIWFI